MIGAMIVKRMVRTSFDMMNRGDVDSVMASWADDAVYDSVSELCTGVTIKGKKAIAELHRKYFEEFPKMKFTVKSICNREALPLLSAFIGTSVVMADWSITVTHREGRVFTYDGVTVTHIRRGKVIHVSDYYLFSGLPELSPLMKTLIKPSGKA